MLNLATATYTISTNPSLWEQLQEAPSTILKMFELTNEEANALLEIVKAEPIQSLLSKSANSQQGWWGHMWGD